MKNKFDKELAFKEAIITTEIESLNTQIEDLQKKLFDLENDLAYLHILKNIDEEYGDLFESK